LNVFSYLSVSLCPMQNQCWMSFLTVAIHLFRLSICPSVSVLLGTHACSSISFYLSKDEWMDGCSAWKDD
jgi:hypothetical protein